MSFAQDLGTSLQGFVSGFTTVANQYNFTVEIPASLDSSDLIKDPETGQLVPDPDAPNSPLTIKMWLVRKTPKNTDLQPEPGTNREFIEVKGNLVDPRTISRFPDTENGLKSQFLVSGVWRDCLLFDFQIMPTPWAEIMRSEKAIGLPVQATVQIQQGA